MRPFAVLACCMHPFAVTCPLHVPLCCDVPAGCAGPRLQPAPRRVPLPADHALGPKPARQPGQ
eukprot:305852-Chlamydomonas_euryale.AAC.1